MAVAQCGPVGQKDQKDLVYKGSRFWVYRIRRANSNHTSYILTLSRRYDCWLLIENVYDDGDIVRHWANYGYHFDFVKMSWVKD